MTLPVGLPTIAVSGGEVYRLSDGSLPSSLRVVLTASVPAIVWDGKTVVMDPYILDAASGVGTVSGSVPPTNHPDVAPQGFTYSVAEWVNGKPFRTRRGPIAPPRPRGDPTSTLARWRTPRAHERPHLITRWGRFRASTGSRARDRAP